VTRSRKIIFVFAMLVFAAMPLALAQGTYTQIDVPGAVGSGCWGIDAAGDISGAYTDASGNSHGFLLSGGTYTTVDYPGALNTQLFGMNDEGQVVGYDGAVGFVYDIQIQTFTEISHVGASYTVPTAINNAGTIAGYFNAKTSLLGFELVGTKYTTILPPDTFNVEVFGIASSGMAVGEAQTKSTNSRFFNFLFKNGKSQPVLLGTGGNPVAYGINSSGTAIVGEYAPSGIGEGFLFQNGTMQPLPFPGARYTYAYSINEGGEIVGTFVDTNDNIHGFTWTPPADAGKK
jgi:uncharacterized membrane protein